MTCSHLWTPSLEPRTVVHSWYRHSMNEAAALDKEEEELNSELLEMKNRCKRAAVPGAYRFKHGEDDNDDGERVVSLASPPHGFVDDDDDPDLLLPALISESSGTPDIFSPSAEINTASPTERRATDSTGRMIPPDTRGRNHEVSDSGDVTSRNSVESNLVSGDDYNEGDVEVNFT
ncbi:10760_t:CDS:2 [Acaulospora colombiana]|uniref:10760_t:CDS:1 n=1 Tax=Acaulospora colombiana TaxID=27376 RepID=A0ACA9KBZ9_9GLOM|nr:10760_t:CDS:2 [Acaulospora colombiana]